VLEDSDHAEWIPVPELKPESLSLQLGSEMRLFHSGFKFSNLKLEKSLRHLQRLLPAQAAGLNSLS
jgi:hypothetical protein